MSVKLMGQAFDLPLPFTDKFILIALLDHADHEGGRIYPSVATIAAKTSCSPRTVQVAMRRLERRGVLRVVTPASQHRPTEYAADLARGAESAGRRICGAQMTAPNQRSGVQNTVPRGAESAPESKRTVKKRTVIRAQAWPADFVLTDERRAYATQYGCRDPAAQWEDFRLWAAERDATAVSWPAKWQRWCRHHLDCSCARAVETEPYVPLRERMAAERQRRAAMGES